MPQFNLQNTSSPSAPKSPNKPYALMDLDDTLFQTMRKIEQWGMDNKNLTVASINKAGEPLSFMTPKQSALFDWLQHSTELIAVTARDTKEIQRVKLSFSSWQVLTHGAVILDKEGQPLPSWQRLMAEQLSAMQDSITQLTHWLGRHDANQLAVKNPTISNINSSNLRITVHYEDFAPTLAVYIAIKHQHRDHVVLQQLATALPTCYPQFAEQFYVHINANNLAILPHAVHKKHAVAHLLAHHLDPQRPSFGFGDSLADLPFLQLLDWYGTPARGQLHESIAKASAQSASCIR